MKLYQTDEYFKTNPDWHWEDAPYKAKAIVKLLEKNRVEFSSCADVGCGVGRIVSLLSKKFRARYCGFDISPGAVAVANKNFPSPDTAYLAEDFLESEDVYDLVLCLDVFEHVPDYLTFLDRLRRRGRFFVFHIPLEMNVLHLLTDRSIHKRKVGGHLHFFSRATALQALADAGYTIRDSRYTFGGIFQPHSFRSVPKLLLKIPRALIAVAAPHVMAKVLGGASLLVLAEPATSSIVSESAAVTEDSPARAA